MTLVLNKKQKQILESFRLFGRLRTQQLVDLHGHKFPARLSELNAKLRLEGKPVIECIRDSIKGSRQYIYFIREGVNNGES
jgi:hypothetical protein